MSVNKNEFIKNLDSVLELFRHFKKKMVSGKTSVDKAFITNFEEIIRNYKIIREEIPDDLVSKFGMPIQVMALQLVEQLRHELEDQRQDLHRHKPEQKIDDKLKNPTLSVKEIDDLLDKRLAILKD
ncbi:MAG: hypothetical protein JW973_01965 [Bacteroidales bacterium]|nr:hypothetical protein [Bacteroidales bacterium]